MSLSNYTEQAVLTALKGGTAFSVAATYVQLHTGDPGETGTANVATETTRKVVTWADPSSGSMASNSDCVWSSYPAVDTISHVSVWDASTSGNCLWAVTLNAPRTTAVNDTCTLASGALTVTLD